MWVLDILVPILILGTLSLTSAEVKIQNGNEPNSTENETTEVCGLNFGLKEFNSFKNGWEFFSNCSDHLNSTELEEDSENAFWGNGWTGLVEKYCSKVPSFIQCAGQVIDSVKPCLDTETQKSAEVNHNNTRAYFEFLCENDGQRILSLLIHEGVECLGAQTEAAQACRGELSDNNTLVTSTQNELPIWVDMGRSDCAGLAKYEVCITTVLRTCEDKVPADIVQSVVNLFKSIKSCPTAAPAQGSPAA